MEFHANYKTLLGKEIEGPDALDIADFAWNRLFRIQEPVIQEYVLKFLSSFKFRGHVMEIDIVDTMVFQLGGVKRSMSIRQFILALGLYTEEEMNNNMFEFFRDACRHNAKEKEKGAKKKIMIVGAHLIGRIARYNRLGLGELVDDMLDNSNDKDAVAEARRAQDEAGDVRCHPNISFTNRLRAMDDRLGDIDTNIYKLSNNVEELTTVVSGMSEQYDQFYGEFNTMREE
ncbi:hypothetical protein Tco_0140668 [Tanacetum coccineum]